MIIFFLYIKMKFKLTSLQNWPPVLWPPLGTTSEPSRWRRCRWRCRPARGRSPPWTQPDQTLSQGQRRCNCSQHWKSLVKLNWTRYLLRGHINRRQPRLMVGLTPSLRERNPPRKLKIPCNNMINKRLAEGLPLSLGNLGIPGTWPSLQTEIWSLRMSDPGCV